MSLPAEQPSAYAGPNTYGQYATTQVYCWLLNRCKFLFGILYVYSFAAVVYQFLIMLPCAAQFFFYLVLSFCLFIILHGVVKYMDSFLNYCRNLLLLHTRLSILYHKHRFDLKIARLMLTCSIYLIKFNYNFNYTYVHKDFVF